MQYRVMIASFPYSESNVMDLQEWISQTLIECRDDPRIGPGNVAHWRIADTPITMTRNRCLKVAESGKFDFVLMLDSDMAPDIPYQDAKPFWKTTFDFAVNHPGPFGAIAAPYCGPPPHENVFVFRWTNMQSNHPNGDFQIESYARADAMHLKGILPCAALPTGVCLIDMRGIKKLKEWKAAYGKRKEIFYYEWKDDDCTDKASTEDVTFSRDLTYAGCPCYANWDAWAGHWKMKMVGKPTPIPVDVVPEWIRNRAKEIAREEMSLPQVVNAAVQPQAVDGQEHHIVIHGTDPQTAPGQWMRREQFAALPKSALYEG